MFMQKRYCWAPEHETYIRRNFEEKGASRLRDTFGELRKRRKEPLWLSDSTWKSLQEYWASEKFLKMSSQAKKNRNSEQDGLGHSLHRSGSVPFTKHRRCMAKKLNRDVTDLELLKDTHVDAANKWVDKKSEKRWTEHQLKWDHI